VPRFEVSSSITSLTSIRSIYCSNCQCEFVREGCHRTNNPILTRHRRDANLHSRSYLSRAKFVNETVRSRVSRREPHLPRSRPDRVTVRDATFLRRANATIESNERQTGITVAHRHFQHPPSRRADEASCREFKIPPDQRNCPTEA